jgi:26S proteasome regulatory subunit N6
MKNRIQTRLAEVHYINGFQIQALEIISKTLVDLKRYEDNLGLIIVQLIESKIHYANKGITKAKAALTSVKTLCTKVYIEPRLQASIDMHAGIIAAHEKDYNLAYSYFYESFDVYNLHTVRKTNKARKCLQYMLLCKIMSGSIDDVNAIIISKQAQKYLDRSIEALKSMEEAVRQKSVHLLQTNKQKYAENLNADPLLVYHLDNLHQELLEKNLIKIIQPYSVVEIDFITRQLQLEMYEVLVKLSQMILDKKINGILDQGRGSLIIYDEIVSNVRMF